MAKLSFIGELNERQIEYADKIRAKAIEMGIPPALAVSIAYHESRLNPDAPRGQSGEFGIMQVMPATGKGMGFTNKDLADPDKNIEAGLKYLKQNLDAFGGDPKMATVGYNAGTDSPFFSGGPLPKSTEAYVKAMKGYGAYNTETAEQEAPAEGEMVSVPAPPESLPEADMSGADKAARFLFGGAGAATGVAVTGAGAGLDALENRAVRVAGKTEAAKIAEQTKAANIAAQRAPTVPNVVPTAAPVIQQMGPTSPLQATDNQATRILQGTTGDEGTTGRARMQGFNEQTAQQSAQRKEMDRLLAQLRGAGVVADDAPAVFAKNPGMTSTASGVVYPRSQPAPTLGPRTYGPPSIQAQAAQSGPLPIKETAPYQIGATKPPIIPTPPPKPVYNLYSVIDEFKSMMRPITSAVGTVGKYVLPPLGGLSAGLDLAELAHEYKKPDASRDLTKMGLSAASGLGGVMSMFPPSAPVGVPLSLGASGIQYLRNNPDLIKRKMQGISDIPLLDEMTGPLP